MIIHDQGGLWCDERPVRGDWVELVDQMTLPELVASAFIMRGCACDGCAAMRSYTTKAALRWMDSTPPMEERTTCLLWLYDNYNNITNMVDDYYIPPSDGETGNDKYIH